MIERLVLPDTIRVDSGVEEGDEVGLRYDPLLAKLIAHGATRAEALSKLEDALSQTVVTGVETNLASSVGHSASRIPRRRGVHCVSHRPPAALDAAPARAGGSWATAWRLNLPAPAPAPPPDIAAASGEHSQGDGTVTSLHAGNRDRGRCRSR